MNIPTVNQPTSEQIAIRAYLIWVEEGRPHGRDAAHWALAEKQLQADSAHQVGTLSKPAAAVPSQRQTRRINFKRQEAFAI